MRPCTALQVQTIEKEAVGLNNTKVSTIVPGPRLNTLLEPPPPVSVVDEDELLSLIDVRASTFCRLLLLSCSHGSMHCRLPCFLPVRAPGA